MLRPGRLSGLDDTVLTPEIKLRLPGVDGEVATTEIETVVRGQASAIDACYQREHLEIGFDDMLSFTFVITGDGTARSVDVAGFDIAVADCVAGVLTRARFPRPRHGVVRVDSYLTFNSPWGRGW